FRRPGGHGCPVQGGARRRSAVTASEASSRPGRRHPRPGSGAHRGGGCRCRLPSRCGDPTAHVGVQPGGILDGQHGRNLQRRIRPARHREAHPAQAVGARVDGCHVRSRCAATPDRGVADRSGESVRREQGGRGPPRRRVHRRQNHRRHLAPGLQHRGCREWNARLRHDSPRAEDRRGASGQGTAADHQRRRVRRPGFRSCHGHGRSIRAGAGSMHTRCVAAVQRRQRLRDLAQRDGAHRGAGQRAPGRCDARPRGRRATGPSRRQLTHPARAGLATAAFRSGHHRCGRLAGTDGAVDVAQRARPGALSVGRCTASLPHERDTPKKRFAATRRSADHNFIHNLSTASDLRKFPEGGYLSPSFPQACGRLWASRANCPQVVHRTVPRPTWQWRAGGFSVPTSAPWAATAADPSTRRTASVDLRTTGRRSPRGVSRFGRTDRRELPRHGCRLPAVGVSMRHTGYRTFVRGEGGSAAVALTDDRSPALAGQAPTSSSTGGGFDRQPPQDIAAEQSVLGGMLLSKDAIADVLEVLRPSDFYRPAHQAIYDAVLDLYSRGEPADPITISAELERRGELARVGGAPYLHTLIATVPTAANAAYYAQIVAEKAVLRRLVEAGTRIVQYGYGAADAQGDAVDEVVDRAQAAIFEVTERRTSEDYVALEELLQPTMDEIDAIASDGGISRGVPTGFTDLDEVTNGLHPGQMIIVAARPGIGKSTLGLDFCRSASIKHGMTSVIFSLEMSRTEIVMRMLSAEARIRLQDMR